MATLVSILSWLILSLEVWHGAHAIFISGQLTPNKPWDNLQLRELPRNTHRPSYQTALSQGKPVIRSTSIWLNMPSRSAATKKLGNLETTLTTSSSDDISQQHTLVKRVDTSKKSGDGNKKAASPNNPNRLSPSSSKPQKFSPMTNHVNQRVTIPNPLFTPITPKRDPLGISMSSPGSPRSPQSPSSPRTSLSPFDRGRPSSSGPRRQGSSQDFGITPESPRGSQRSPRGPYQREQTPEAKRQGSRELPPSGKEIKEWQKSVGLAWDWAGRHPRLACAAGAVVLGGCASITGIPLIAYGSTAAAKGVGVGLAMTGPTMATTAGTTVAVVGIGEYKKGEAISEKRQEEKWNELLEKSRLKKVPSVDRISQTMKPSLEKISSSIKSTSNVALDNLKKLNIGLKRSPTEESLTSPKLDDLTIPEDPHQDMAATWSSPASFPSRNKSTNPRKTASLQMKVFKKDPPQ